jgi:hypothetical protein
MTKTNIKYHAMPADRLARNEQAIRECAHRLARDYGFDFFDATCMAASWHIAALAIGREDFSIERDQVECDIQMVLHALFGKSKES